MGIKESKVCLQALEHGDFDCFMLQDNVAGAHYQYVPATPEIIDRVKKIQAVCEQFNVALPEAAMQFPLHHPAIASVVTGMRNKDHVEKNLAWIQKPIPTEFWLALKKDDFIPENAPI